MEFGTLIHGVKAVAYLCAGDVVGVVAETGKALGPIVVKDVLPETDWSDIADNFQS